MHSVTFPVNIRKAKTSEAALLTILAFSSKAYWGYDDGFMESCREELQISEEKILENSCFVAEHNAEIVGFYMLETIGPAKMELDMLFVDPKFIGKGLGKQLFIHAIKIVEQQSFKEIIIQADPYAQPFYEKMGAILKGYIPSQSISNRNLPLMQYKLKALS
ncbi:MAG: GNAT family N-acetyltransferase [Bacteroidota bacterium]